MCGAIYFHGGTLGLLTYGDVSVMTYLHFLNFNRTSFDDPNAQGSDDVEPLTGEVEWPSRPYVHKIHSPKEESQLHGHGHEHDEKEPGQLHAHRKHSEEHHEELHDHGLLSHGQVDGHGFHIHGHGGGEATGPSFEAIVDRFKSLDEVRKAIKAEGLEECGLIFGKL